MPAAFNASYVLAISHQGVGTVSPIWLFTRMRYSIDGFRGDASPVSQITVFFPGIPPNEPANSRKASSVRADR